MSWKAIDVMALAVGLWAARGSITEEDNDTLFKQAQRQEWNKVGPQWAFAKKGDGFTRKMRISEALGVEK
jgi:hypothetical protein